MYQHSQPNYLAPSGYTSPPMPQDAYRASPIPMQARSPYMTSSSALSPPPPSSGSGFSAIPTSGSSSRHHQQIQSIPQYASRSGSARYPISTPGQGYGQPQTYANGPLPIPPQQTPQQKYKGTLAPGTIIKVGESHVRIERYLSEGGYAHVYLTTSERPIYPPTASGGLGTKGRWGEKGYTQHCLKRIAFEDEKVWVDVRKEIDVMKALPPNPHLTQYLASAHSRLPNGGYEVFILMEFCSGGGIIDLLNKRLRDRLKEIEILNIFTDVCEAVAAMHFLKQPLLHRDLKIENVLSAPTGQPASSSRPTPLIFKLCDFGSTTFPSSHPPQNKGEADALAANLNKHTTLQYRSPEMVEPMLGWAVGLPSDVWALGVLLYKLCYYTTPFEEHGTLAIVNAKYSFPQYPVYSPKIQHLIASMLVDHPARRPSVFEILNVAHEMSGTRPEIDYPIPSRSFPPSSQSTSKPKSNSTNLLDFTSPSPISSPAPSTHQDLATTVQPQRRGRPTREPSNRPMSSFTAPGTASPAAGLPPLPQPPSVPVDVKADVKPSLQVTGERARPTPLDSTAGNGSPEVKKPSTDAFGMPAKGAVTTSPINGFGDSFASSQPQSKGVGGVSQRFGGSTLKSNSGFSDSFNIPRTSTQPTLPSFRVASPDSTLPASTSTPAGDQSFETRFPSIDTLDSSDGFSPSITPQPPKPAKSVSDLISPIMSPPATSTKPGLTTRPSMMGHLTGEPASNTHQSLPARVEGGPQPRSTQVTGTAFKRSGETPVSEKAVKGDYFDQTSKSGSSKPTSGDKSPVDLMTGDAYSSMTSTSRQNSQAGSSRTNTRPGPTSNPSRTRLPTLGTSRSGNSVKSLSTSPVDLKQGGGNSSDEEDVQPESASGTGMRPPSPSAAARSALSSNGASTTRAPPGSLAPKPQLNNLLQSSSDKMRPQSMFIPSSASSSSPSQPLASPSSTLSPTAGTSGRPSHVRKGSITDIVSRFETLHSPKTPSDGSSPSDKKQNGDTGSVDTKGSEGPKGRLSNGLGRKPSVASKPQALRKPTIEPNATPKDISSSSPSSSTPTISTPSHTSLNTDKPSITSRTSRHGEMPTVAGYSKSSSGRSFPISRPVQSTTSSALPPRSTTPLKETPNETSNITKGQSGAGTGSRPGSPEKQQSVGSLIARWNQNKV